jgi:FkbM family methyltransferase
MLKSIAKVLGLKELGSKINYHSSIHLNKKRFVIPILKNMGRLNLAIKEDWLLQFLKNINFDASATFVDIGVNVGQTLLNFRSVYNGPYLGFEPNPSCVFYLHNLIQVNGFKNTQILPVGLSNKNQLAKFFIKNESDSAGTVLSELRPGFYDQSAVNYVPLFKFDDLDLSNVSKIALIKIDVEGAELEVIQGMLEAIEKFQPLVICEVLDSHNLDNIPPMQQRADQLVKIIQALNYKVYRIRQNNSTIRYEPIENIELRLWTSESWNLNDYLFAPATLKL